MKVKNSIFALWACLLLGLKSNAQSNLISENKITEINQVVERVTNNDRFSGTVLIAQGAKIVYQKAVGLANKETKSKNNIETKFNLASMNKMFTSISIAQLVEQNKLSFDDKVTKHLPNLPEKTFGKITIAQLLTHTAGTCDFFRIPKFMDIKDTAKTINTYVNLGINEPLLFEPRARFEYSNYGYILLGAVIEQISKMSYFDYVKNNIFKVAGMENTDSYSTDNVNINMAIGYAMPPPMPGQAPPAMGEKVVRKPNTKLIEVKGTSAGGGYSTAIDLHKFSTALLSGKLVSLKTLDILTKGKIAMPAPMIMLPPNAKPLPETKYGYGFGEVYKNGVRIVGHNGGAPGVEGQLGIYPNFGYSVIILSNYDMIVMPLMNRIEEIITTQK
jgi:CubicO group peptidase (beta-lactamase class C family)